MTDYEKILNDIDLTRRKSTTVGQAVFDPGISAKDAADALAFAMLTVVKQREHTLQQMRMVMSDTCFHLDAAKHAINI